MSLCGLDLLPIIIIIIFVVFALSANFLKEYGDVS